MNTIILLDTGPLGYVTYPGASSDHQECSEWLEAKILAGIDNQAFGPICVRKEMA